jgi:hypothetical protein
MDAMMGLSELDRESAERTCGMIKAFTPLRIADD